MLEFGKYSWKAPSLLKYFETISGKFQRAEIKFFQTDADEGWKKFIWHVTNHGITHELPNKFTWFISNTSIAVMTECINNNNNNTHISIPP